MTDRADEVEALVAFHYLEGVDDLPDPVDRRQARRRAEHAREAIAKALETAPPGLAGRLVALFVVETGYATVPYSWERSTRDVLEAEARREPDALRRVGFALLYGGLGDTAEDLGLQLLHGLTESGEEDIVARIIAEHPNEWALELEREKGER